ncbi:hypothetical protein [Pseudomonas sp. BN607]|jgi:hypothetical protein|uniref:hypothetical protein n=1 Tax=Pseudomonas sp. BN607 TaxID=2567895 RepID=UPI0024539B6C|nr:hypothetical protein [Pseudomonas sp. BN607]MDH4550862.1 hypothetical protein [Pseudomonas sp. BN607]
MATSSEAVAQLIKVMNSSLGVSAELKIAAAEGLGYAGGDVARAALIKVMNSSLGVSKELKVAAAKALGHASQD